MNMADFLKATEPGAEESFTGGGAGIRPDPEQRARDLAKMKPMEYQQRRKDEADELGIRVTVLDAAVARLRRQAQTYMPPEITEDGVALAFTARHRDTLRFDHDQGRWVEWTGDHWRPDGTHLAFSFCREIAREMSDGEDERLKATARKAAFAGGVEKMARADRAHAVTSEAWDQNPFILGCPGVSVDLRTGRTKTPDPADGITKMTAVAPDDRDCPIWLRFLTEATGNDAEMVRFLQQWMGYCLTGDTREHALLFVHGPGGNGKSVWLETLAYILGDYATAASMDTFTASKSDRHPTDMAMLRGARMVSASETEEGRAC